MPVKIDRNRWVSKLEKRIKSDTKSPNKILQA